MIALNTQSGLKYHQGELVDLNYESGPWNDFMDMHSGGGCKIEKYEHIYIQMAEEQARNFFFATFWRDPDNITCDCCGSDYSVNEYATLEAASVYERNFGHRLTLEAYATKPTVLIIVTQEQDKEATDA